MPGTCNLKIKVPSVPPLCGLQLWTTSLKDAVEHSKMMWLPLTYLMKSFLIIFLIFYLVALVIFVQELSSKQQKYTRPWREKTCLLGFRQSESQTSLLSLTGSKKIESRYDFQKANNKVADETTRMRRLICGYVVTNHQGQFFSVAVQLLYVILPWLLRCEICFREIWYKSDRIVICAVSSKHLQCVYRHTKSYPASDRFLYHNLIYES